MIVLSVKKNKKTKVLISCAVTAQLICAFVFIYAKLNLFHDVTKKVQWPFAQSVQNI